MAKIFLISTLCLLMCACQGGSIKSTYPKAVIDTSCSSFSPIYTYGDDYKTIDVRTVRQINTHNQVWDQLCGSENGRVK